jgi:hypothetical protein
MGFDTVNLQRPPSPETIGAFNTGFDTVNLHFPPSAEIIGPFNTGMIGSTCTASPGGHVVSVRRPGPDLTRQAEVRQLYHVAGDQQVFGLQVAVEVPVL